MQTETRENIFSPVRVGNMELNCRTIYIASSQHLCTPDFQVTDEYVAFYETLAKHGVPLMITGAMITDGTYPSFLSQQAGIYDDGFLPGLRRVTSAVHQYGSRILFQLWHPGQAAYNTSKENVKTCADWSVEEIHRIQQLFCDAAVRAKKAGADGIEWHMAHNYLPEQFLVPLFNKRNDAYSAGTVENGMRFSLETLEKMRETCDEDFTIVAKINGTDAVPDGISKERLVRACELLEQAGVSMITVSGGGTETDVTGMSGDGKKPEGWKVPYAALVKQHVRIPVAASGSIRHPAFVNLILQERQCDLVGISRGFVADPEWIEKVREGREDEIRYCISCMMCFGTYGEGYSGCSVNPRMRRYATVPENLSVDGDDRIIAIVGAGPAGLQAAVTAAARGFKPVVFEARDAVGGAELLASKPAGKQKIEWHITYLENVCRKQNVEIRLNTKAETEMLEKLNPYAIIIASGGNPLMPKSIRGLDKPHVYDREILMNMPDITNEHIVVAGMGQVGMEIAETFACMGNQVTIIDILEKPPITGLSAALTFRHMKESGVHPVFGHGILEIEDHAVITENIRSHEKESFEADRVIMCLGVKSNDSLFEELTQRRKNVFKIGECAATPGNIKTSIQEAYDTVCSL